MKIGLISRTGNSF